MFAVESRVCHDALAQAFAQVLARPDSVLTDPDALAAHSHDYWGLGSAPWMVVKPRTTDEVVAIVRIAAEHGVPLVTRGGASNCAGAVMADDERVMIDLSGMNQLISVDTEARTARVQPGIVNNTLQEALAPQGLCFSPDPVSSHFATVGGNIIENAGGPHALKYGVTYHHVLEAEAVLADGTVVTLTADAEGTDLLGILIGSEGTLAILTEATVALRPIPAVTRSLAVDYLQPVPLHQSHRITARIHAREGRALHVAATGTGEDGVVRFTATAMFVTVDAEHFAAHGDLGEFGEMLERFARTRSSADRIDRKA